MLCNFHAYSEIINPGLRTEALKTIKQGVQFHVSSSSEHALRVRADVCKG